MLYAQLRCTVGVLKEVADLSSNSPVLDRLLGNLRKEKCGTRTVSANLVTMVLCIKELAPSCKSWISGASAHGSYEFVAQK